MLKSRTGGNIIGSGRNGRAWRAVTRVARSIGGNGEPVKSVKVHSLEKVYGGNESMVYRKW